MNDICTSYRLCCTIYPKNETYCVFCSGENLHFVFLLFYRIFVLYLPKKMLLHTKHAVFYPETDLIVTMCSAFI